MAPRPRKITMVANTKYGYDVFWTERYRWCYAVHHANGDLTPVHHNDFATATEALHAAVILCWELEKRYEHAK